MNTLFDLDAIPTQDEASVVRYEYHLYFDKDGVRRFLYLKRGVGHRRRWEWLTPDEAGARRIRHRYSGMAAATRGKRHWQRMAKGDVVVCIGSEVKA